MKKFTGEKLTGHGGAIYGLTTGRLKERFYSASSDGFVAEWEVGKTQPLPFSVKVGLPLFSVLFNAESGLLFTGNAKGGVHVISPENKKEVKLLHHHNSFVLTLGVSAKHNLFLSGSADGTLSINTLENLEPKKVIRISEKKVRNIAFNSDESLVAISCGEGNVQLFTLPDLEPLSIVKAHELSANISLFTEKEHFLSGGRDAMLNNWKIEGNSIIKKNSIPAHNYAIYDMALSPDGEHMITGSGDKTIKVWNIEPEKPLIRLDRLKNNGHAHSVNRVLWPLEDFFISAGDDKTIIVWNIS